MPQCVARHTMNAPQYLEELQIIKPTNRLEVEPFLRIYSLVEYICKQYHNLPPDLSARRDFLDSLPDDFTDKYLIPFAEKLLPRFEMRDNEIHQVYTLAFSEGDKKLYVEKHVRYMPAFIHDHDFFELMYVYSGSCVHEVEGKEIQLHGGDICLIPPFTSHKVMVFDDSVLINIHIKPSTFQNIFFDLLDNYDILSVFFNRALDGEYQNKYLLFHTFGDPKIKEIINDILIEYWNENQYFEKILVSMMKIFLGLLLRNHDNSLELGDMTHKKTNKFVDVINFIQSNYKTVTLSTLSRKFYYSSPHLSKLIFKQTGKTFTHLVSELKINKACYLLVNSNMTVQDIGFEVGYNSQEHFIRSFKKIKNITPNKYRTDHTPHDAVK